MLYMSSMVNNCFPHYKNFHGYWFYEKMLNFLDQCQSKMSCKFGFTANFLTYQFVACKEFCECKQ